MEPDGRAHALRSRIWRAAEAATTPLLPSDYLDLFSPLRPGAALRGRIVDVQPETADAATIVIRPGADWAGHVPGQYVRVGIDVDGVRQWRAYSLTHDRRRDQQHLDHGQGGPRRDRQQPPGPRGAPRHAGAPRAGRPATSSCPRRGQVPLRHRRVAASPRSSASCATCSRSPSRASCTWCAARTTTSRCCTSRRPSRTRSSSTTSRPSTPRARSAWSPGTTTCTASSTSTGSTSWSPICRERQTFACGPGGAAGGAARSTTRRAGLKLFTEQFRGQPRRRRRGRHRHLRRLRHRRRGRRRHSDPRGGRGGRRPHAERLPHGHLLQLRPRRCARAPSATCATARITTAAEGDGVVIQTCINAAAGDCHIDH